MYSAVWFAFSFALPAVARRLGCTLTHGLCLLCTIVTEPAAAPNSSHSQASLGKPAESSV